MPTIKDKLTHGMKLGDTVHKDFEIREQYVSDLEGAEKDSEDGGAHAMNCALIARVLVRVGDNTGPFTAGQIAKLRRTDYLKLLAAAAEAEKLGEAESSGVAAI